MRLSRPFFRAGRTIAVAAIITAAGAAGAGAAWGPSRVVTENGANPTIAGNADGVAVEAWYLEGTTSSTVIARTSRDGGRTWGPDQVLGGATEDDGGAGANIRVAVGPGGVIAVTWQHLYRHQIAIMLATAGPTGRFGRPAVVSARGFEALDPDVAVDAAGTSVVAWITERGVERAVVLRNGRITSRRILPGSADAGEPAVAVDARGDRAYAWIDTGNGCDTCAAASLESAIGVIGRMQILSSVDSGDDADAPVVGLSRQGAASVVWEQSTQGAGATIQAAFAPPGRRFGETQQLSRRLTSESGDILAGSYGGRGIGVDRAGQFSTVWVDVPQGATGPSRVQVDTSTAAGVFGPPRTLQSTGGELTYERPAVAVTPNGRVFATWTLYNSDTDPSRAAGIWGAASGSNGASFAQAVHLAGANGDMSAVAAISSSAAIAVWSDSASGTGLVDGSRWNP